MYAFGSWLKIGNLLVSFVRASNVGEGTANAIKASYTSPPLSDALIIFNTVATNTNSNVTVSFDAGIPLPIRTAGNNLPPAGGIVSGMMLAGVIDNGNFRLVSDLATAAFQAGAEAAYALAEAARAAAVIAKDQTPAYLEAAAGAGTFVPATQSEAEVAKSNTKAMTPLRSIQSRAKDGW